MTELHLKIDIDALREIYFRDNNAKYFFGPQTKKQSNYLVIGLILFPVLSFYSLYNKNGGLFILSLITLYYFIYDFVKSAREIIKWRKSVEKFLIMAQNIKDLRFIYNDDYFTHIQDNGILKQDWSVVESAIINDRFIWLFSNTDVLLPKSSLTESEYELLSDFVLKKVKNVQKN